MCLGGKTNIRRRVAPTADVLPPERSRFAIFLLTTNCLLLVGMFRSLLFSIHPRNSNTCFGVSRLHPSDALKQVYRDVYISTYTRPAHNGLSGRS